MVKITLNAFELRLCKALAAVRQGTNDSNGVIDHRIADDKTSLDIHYLGAMGEVATAKYFNVYPDFTTQSRSGGCDLVFKGYKIDAKNSHPHRNLMVRITKKLGEADIYVCVTGDNPIYLLGWCYEDQIINPRRIAKWAQSPAYFMKESELFSITEIAKIKEREYVPKLSLEELAMRGLWNSGTDTSVGSQRGSV